MKIDLQLKLKLKLVIYFFTFIIYKHIIPKKEKKIVLTVICAIKLKGKREKEWFDENKIHGPTFDFLILDCFIYIYIYSSKKKIVIYIKHNIIL